MQKVQKINKQVGEVWFGFQVNMVSLQIHSENPKFGSLCFLVKINSLKKLYLADTNFKKRYYSYTGPTELEISFWAHLKTNKI
jgi:hypothetical protein